MKGLAITSKGIEDVCALEILDLIKTKAIVRKGCCEFECEDEGFFKLAYLGQSVTRVLILLKEIKALNVAEIFDSVSTIVFDDWIKPGTRFKVECQREGTHDFNSTDVEKALLKNISDRHKDAKAEMKNPEVTVYVYLIGEECFIGIDVCGRDLSKREYKIFNNPYSIKPTIAYAVGRIAEIKENEVILDPFCGTGEITIEAALHLGRFSHNNYSKNDFLFRKMVSYSDIDFNALFSKLDSKQRDTKSDIHAFDHQMRNMNACKKNAKIAGINKQLHIARVDTDWLELKLAEKSVDKIITRLPSIPKDDKAKIMSKVIDDFFYQAEFVLKKKGKICALVQKKEGIEEAMKKYGFHILSDKEVWQGKEKYHIILMSPAD